MAAIDESPSNSPMNSRSVLSFRAVTAATI